MSIKERLIIGITIVLWIGIAFTVHIPTLFTSIKIDEDCAISHQEFQIPISMISVTIDNQGNVYILMDKHGGKIISVYNNEGEFVHTIVLNKLSKERQIFINEENVLSLVQSNTIDEIDPKGCIINSYNYDMKANTYIYEKGSIKSESSTDYERIFFDELGNKYVVNKRAGFGYLEITKTINSHSYVIFHTNSGLKLNTLIRVAFFIVLIPFQIMTILIIKKRTKKELNHKKL